MNILITGARAPICADMARVLHGAGHQVFTADCLRFPIGRFSPFVQRHVRLPAPAKHFREFSRRLEALVEHYGIDWIIPTSEEVFWLARIPSLKEKLFAPDAATLTLLHDKARFAELATSLGYGADDNIRLDTLADAAPLLNPGISENYVLKPVYSRFGTDILMSPTPDDIRNLDYHRPWLAQTRVYGEEVCIYSIAASGEMLLFVAYRPRHRAGPGASIYFEPVADARLREFASTIIRSLNLTGQICFDVMLTGNSLVALECNPRGTSGAHLAAQNPWRFASALIGKGAATETKNTLPKPMYLGMPLLLYHGLRWLIDPALRADIKRADEAMKRAQIATWSSLAATAELLLKAALSRKSLLAVSTEDIEWNGPSAHD